MRATRFDSLEQLSSGSVQVHSVPDDDITLYAHGMFRSRGIAARKIALSRAKSLSDIGDHEGFLVWNDVANKISKIAS